MARAIALTIALALAACDFSALMPKEHVEFAKAVVMLVQNRDAEGLEAVAEPALWRQLTPAVRDNMARMFPHEPAASISVTSYKSSFDNTISTVSVVLLYRYPREDVQAAVSFRSAEHGFVLTAIDVLPGDAPPQRTNDSSRDS